jgi:hypothetical protein
MKKVLLLFTACLMGLGIYLNLGEQADSQGQVAGPPNAILCNQGAQIGPTSAVSAFTAVTSVTAKTVFLCGWHVTATSGFAAFFQISQGACGTSMAAMTPSLAVTNTAPATDHIDFAMISTGVGQSLCFSNNTLNSSVSAVLWFSQF